MELNKVLQSQSFKITLWALGSLVVLLLIFKAGVMVGYHKANFSYRWGENYHKNFGGPRGGFFREPPEKDFINGHGVAGQIIKIDDDTLVIKGRDDVENMVILKNNTTIRRMRDSLHRADLKINDQVIVIGEPNDAGGIEAKFIRLMPPLMWR